MKTILILCAATLVVGAALTWKAVRMPSQYGTFSGAPKADVADLIERPKEFLHKTVTIEGTVRQQCTTMGLLLLFLLRKGYAARRITGDRDEGAQKERTSGPRGRSDRTL